MTSFDIRDHKLAWRWTNPDHAVLPDAVLDQMIPFSSDQAAEAFRHGCSLNGANGLSDTLFDVYVTRTDTLDRDQGRVWLLAHQPNRESSVILSWQPDTALKTTWGIFTDYWDDFCYGASDDLSVWPEDEDWALLFHHEDEFHFGVATEKKMENKAQMATPRKPSD